MVHTRLNEKESNPNPHINFISALPNRDPTENESARQVLRALAAQVRPVMKAHGFSVNSFEEYEYNSVFSGRNWNAGETIELVLRRPNGTFLPTFWLMSTLCHELAHIKHMNHGHGFQALWKKLDAEVQGLQNKGYYGDGYWSSGTRLSDSSRVAGEGIIVGDLPEYVCGGAQSRRRPGGLRRRQAQKSRDTTVIASAKSGRQTVKPRKAGMRVKSNNAFIGEGVTLVEKDGEGKIRGDGTGFGKQASSKRAREERALAIEKRLRAMEGQSGASMSTSGSLSKPHANFEIFELDDSEDDEVINETDDDRRQTLLSSEQDDDLQSLKSGKLWEYIEHNFGVNKRSRGNVEGSPGCDFPVSSGLFGTNGSSSNTSSKRKRISDDDPGRQVQSAKKLLTKPSSAPLSAGNIIQSEINLRKKESLGMEPIRSGGRTLGPYAKESREAVGSRMKIMQIMATRPQWSCLACTFLNEADYLACSVCTTPRTETQSEQ
ncbi:WLM domain-containing protein [Collybia nuda]|uniref:WLM domain-containing protein n=1 Tax=Collybia nuda TaxID=64659 RepID=A0A9P6CPL4_9AGAR|nr:WLM domain-containing protein [Collybia nuda]